MNIYDIADKCGVSIATVSRVLNNNPNVSAATRAKILAVMEEANYTPSALARSLGSGAEAASATASAAPAVAGVGVLCANLCDPYSAGIIAGLEELLRTRHTPMLLRTIGDTPEEEQQSLTDMIAAGVTAVICISPIRFADTDVSPIATAAKQVPIILLDGYVEAEGVYSITCNHRGAMAELVELLMRRQRRRILFLYSRPDHACQEKIEGYQAALAAAGIPYDEALLLQVGTRPEDVNACIKSLLIKRVSFDAVIGAEDSLALGAQKALQRTGLNMPVIGFNNSLIACSANPELTSVDCNTEGMCARALAILDALAENKSAESHTVLPTRLVERDTFRNA
ncbi:MAG: LacI family DNA-binding transcriptional regulator [Clostridia bacterium]|nr:LacI family DNA-binding transcriptional regulator [Clostridia bacterium]